MVSLYRCTRLSATLAFLLVCTLAASRAEEPIPAPCREDAMIVFDASGSMAGNTSQGIATTVPRIDEVRSALAVTSCPARQDFVV